MHDEDNIKNIYNSVVPETTGIFSKSVPGNGDLWLLYGYSRVPLALYCREWC
jgi:hypothetical protein